MKDNKDIQAREVENTVLGAILLDSRILPQVMNEMKVTTFFYEENQLIYKAILDLCLDGSAIDMITVSSKLRDLGTLEKVGGAYYLSQLSQTVNSTANTGFHVKILQQFEIRRDCRELYGDFFSQTQDDKKDIFEVLNDSMTNLLKISNGIKTTEADTGAHIKEFLEMTKSAINTDGSMVGATTGFQVLDNHTNGWMKTDLIYIAGRPAMGKTALIISMLNEQLKQGLNVAFFSLEMGGSQIMQRLVSVETGIELGKIRRGDLNKDEEQRIIHTAEKYNTTGLSICDKAGMTLMEIRSVCNNMKHQKGIDVIYVDYLQLMHGKGQSRENEVGANSRGLKAIAKDFNCPVICLSQLSRAVEQTSDKRPNLSHLRDSGSIEQDADQVYFLYRPEYYGIDFVPTGADGDAMPEGFTELINAKNRNGETKSLFVRFDKRYTRFEDFNEILE